MGALAALVGTGLSILATWALMFFVFESPFSPPLLDYALLALSSLLLFALLGGACLFFALFVLQATLCFWTLEALELMNTMSYGGVESAQYPLVIYGTWFRRFFTFIVPLACVSYFPIVGILDRSDPLGTAYWFQCLAPAAGIAFLLVIFQAWRFGVSRYTSTGS